MAQFGGIDSVGFDDTPNLFFAMKDEMTVEALKKELGRLEQGGSELDSSLTTDMRIVDGVVYRTNPNPSEFTENTWCIENMCITAYECEAVTNYISKHTDETLWFSVPLN